MNSNTPGLGRALLLALLAAAAIELIKLALGLALL
jgi:hypothetical protein